MISAIQLPSTSMHPQDVQTRDLFRESHLDVQGMSLGNWFLLMAYLPFGCVLAALRLILGCSLAFVIPPFWRQRVVQVVAGLIVRMPSRIEMPEKGCCLISNHMSYLDSWVLAAACSPRREFATVVWHGVPGFVKRVARPVIQVFQTGRNRDFLKQLRSQLKQRNVIIFPEGSITDGTTGLLAFERSVFALKYPVHAVAIRYQRPLPFLQPKALSAHLVLQTAIELFQPWTVVELIPLGELTRLEGEAPDDFAARAERCLADALGLATTPWTRHDRDRLIFGNRSTD